MDLFIQGAFHASLETNALHAAGNNKEPSSSSWATPEWSKDGRKKHLLKKENSKNSRCFTFTSMCVVKMKLFMMLLLKFLRKRNFLNRFFVFAKMPKAKKSAERAIDRPVKRVV